MIKSSEIKQFKSDDTIVYKDELVFEEQDSGNIIVFSKKSKKVNNLNSIAFFVLKTSKGIKLSTAEKIFLREFSSEDEHKEFRKKFTETIKLLIEHDLIKLVRNKSNTKDVTFKVVESELENPYIEITSLCNAHCTYCYNKSGQYGQHMDSALLIKIIDELIDLRVKSITLSGGEPSLHPDFFSSVSRIARENIQVNVITNSWYGNNKKYIDELIKCNVQFTLDHCDQKKHDKVKGAGNFTAVRNAITSLSNQGHSGLRTLRVNIVKENMNEIDEFVRLGTSWGVTEIDFRFLHRLGNNNENDGHIDFNETPMLAKNIVKKLEELSSKSKDVSINYSGCMPSISCNFLDKKRKKIKCIARITPDGEVFPCQYFSDPYFSLGYIGEKSIVEITNSLSFQELMEFINIRKEENSNCSNCVWQRICSKGCPAKVFTRYNTIWHDSSECAILKELYNRKVHQSIRRIV